MVGKLAKLGWKGILGHWEYAEPYHTKDQDSENQRICWKREVSAAWGWVATNLNNCVGLKRPPRLISKIEALGTITKKIERNTTKIQDHCTFLHVFKDKCW